MDQAPDETEFASAGLFDVGRRRIKEAFERKLHKYQPLATEIARHLGDLEWQVDVLPWVVGVRGVVDAAGLQRAMAFLGVPADKRCGLTRISDVASVESLVYMHRVRTTGASRTRIDTAHDLNAPPPTSGARKRRREGGDAANNMARWKRLAKDPMRISLHTADA